MLAEEMAQAAEEAAAAASRAKGAAHMLQGLQQMYPELAKTWEQVQSDLRPELATAPRGQEAIKQVLLDAPGTWWSIPALVNELVSRGWAPDSDQPESAVRVAVERVVSANPEQFQKERRPGSRTPFYVYWPNPESLLGEISETVGDVIGLAGTEGIAKRVEEIKDLISDMSASTRARLAAGVRLAADEAQEGASG
jgi:hypothetical protein